LKVEMYGHKIGVARLNARIQDEFKCLDVTQGRYKLKHTT